MNEFATDNPEGARAHARAQGGATVEAMPTVPAAGAEHWPDDVASADRLWAETVGGGNYTALTLARGTIVELTDLEGDACAHIVLHNALEPSERLNVADTVKVQWQAYLREGQLLLSDRGRALATLVADSSGHHDTLAGTSTLVHNSRRYGDGSPQSASPAGRELLILAAAKVGLDPRDIPPTLSFFQGVFAEPDGALRFTGSAGAGARVTLRAELPVTLLIANVPHPLDPRDEYVSTPLRIRAWRGAVPALDPDAAPHASPEAARALANTAAYAALRGI